ncbi:uncharacterized protein LOC6567161 isoform X1 [Drosophila grimshawi]|uniref:GH13747 n=1 Tax=Drosophila grimshawi TaxID=7222 RepID=B4JQS3_DROGR|nr:uncharacterized protein LOC6567161 isoform X1 [Drosophila grimshawi]XP_032595041.1 uncharacterized protein LOC6567161 isoform X1 [Drosophila grimshawi]XP_032595042.1 uncharacterized protein LOC6567161 isoform X1 [Drosophila grimshawi]EDV99253.1 GH13747 [Drosophila grimshawi]
MALRKKWQNRRKWNSEDCEKILDYIREHPFEQPNGVIYYKTMNQYLGLTSSQIELRNKVNSMLSGYQKAKDLISAKRDFPLKEVLKVSPYYRQLHDLFKNTSRKRRRSTIYQRIGNISVSPNTTETVEAMSSDLADNMSECCSASNTVFVQLPTSTDAEAPDKIRLMPFIIKDELISANQAMSASPNEHTFSKPDEENNPHPAEVIPSQSGRATSIADDFGCENNDINVSSTAPTSTEVEEPNEDRLVADPAIIDPPKKATSEHDLKLMELRLRERELDLRLFEIDSNERLTRLKLESKERIAMRKLNLKYAKN